MHIAKNSQYQTLNGEGKKIRGSFYSLSIRKSLNNVLGSRNNTCFFENHLYLGIGGLI